METFGDIADALTNILARGNSESVQAAVARNLREAARFIEQNYSMKYMEQWSRFRLKATATYPTVFEFPNRVKQIRTVRAIIPTETNDRFEFHNLTRLDLRDASHAETAAPNAYWLVGVDRLYFNYTTPVDLDMEVLWYYYTQYPRTVTEERDRQFRNYLTSEGASALLYRAAAMLLAEFRNFDLKAQYDALFDQHLTVLISAESELEHADREYRMNDYQKRYRF